MTFPKFLAVLLVVFAVYHLFFRFEHWTGGKDGSVLFERDHLTGNAYVIEPGQKVSFWDRLLGKPPGKHRAKHGQDSPYNEDTSSELAAEPQSSSLRQTSPEQSPEQPLDADEGDSAFGISNPKKSAGKTALKTSKEAPTPQAPTAADEEVINTLAINDPTTETQAAQVQSTSPKPQIGNMQPLSDRADLNRDGESETVLKKARAGSVLKDISVLSGVKEVFYGQGSRLYALPTSKARWADLVLETGPNRRLVYRYNPSAEGYELFGAE